MDVKHECKLMFTLCQGCLSTDRKLTCVTGQKKALYIKIREDVIQSENDCYDLLLCWECIALLNKLKYFQARIKTAQYRLAAYLHTFYDEKQIPHTLSLLLKTTHKQYDYKYQYIYEEEHKDQLFEQNNLNVKQKDHILEQKDLTLEQKDLNSIFEQKEETDDEKLLIEIKVEKNEIVKEEFEDDNISINNDMDYYEPELKQETGEVVKYKRRNKGPKKSRIKKYEELATISKIRGTFTKNVSPYYETVYVSSREADQIFQETAKYRYDKKFLCKLCNCGYDKRLDYLRHKTIHHTQQEKFPTKCIACKREVTSESDLEEHWKEVHNPMLRCTFCKELSRTKGELKKHLNRLHTKTFTCNSCPMEFRTLAEFSKHYILTHERFTCDYCNKSLFSKRILETHIKKEHLPHYCSICNKNFPAYKNLAHHERKVHMDLSRLRSNETESVELRYCVECDKEFPTILKYKKHLKQSVRHTPKKKVSVPCPECDKIFTRVLYKNNHYRLVHLKKSKHYCVLCDKYFATGFGVRTHIQYVHQKMQMPRNKICDICGRGFSTNRILINHRRTHTGERPFQCPHCPAAFGQKSAMQTHQKSQHKNLTYSTL